MTRAVRPTMKRLVAMQAMRTSSAATAATTATAPLIQSRLNNNNNNNKTSQARLPLHSYEPLESQHHHRQNNVDTHQTDYYGTSSFESALNQVLRLERDSPTSSSSHHRSMETCVRDFFRV